LTTLTDMYDIKASHLQIRTVLQHHTYRYIRY